MVNKWLGNRMLLIMFLLLALASIGVPQTVGRGWNRTQTNYPKNDCGDNFFFQLIRDWTGSEDNCTELGVVRKTVDAQVDAYRAKHGNPLPDEIDDALDQVLAEILRLAGIK